jgi:rod shape determining protein RodA
MSTATPRRLLRNIDLLLIVATVGLIVFGIVMVSSSARTALHPLALIRTQLVHLAAGLLIGIGLVAIDYRVLARYANALYAANIALLAVVLVLGHTALGAQRWVSLGPLGQFQPSEFAKLAIVITLAKYMSDRPGPYRSFLDLLPFLAHISLPMLLIFRQPDLGTALVYGAVLLGMLLVGGARYRDLAALGAGVAAVSPVFWGLLKEYQRRRLLVFLSPSQDPLGAGYGLIQSKIAIGSGMMWGKGLFAGTQNLLQFVPEHQTDFIFSVVGEELGFVGAMVLLGLFLLWLGRGLRIAAVARDRFGMLIAVGIVTMVAFHVFVNIGMTIGIMPITGIPLPFVSYGGSALMTMLWATALLLNIGMRHQKIWF